METAIRTLDKLRSLEQRFRSGELGDGVDFVEWSVSRSHAAAWECIRGTFNHSPFSKGD